MRVHHVNADTMRPLGGRLIDGRGGLLHRAELVCHCLLVDTGTELVLVETGMGSPSVRRPDEWLGRRFVRRVGARPPLAETAVEQVKRLGYAVEDVRHIVLTHLDLDHAGGLVDFPHATVHVYAEELRALQSPRDEAERTRYRQIQFEHGPQWMSYPDSGEPWFGFDAVRELKGLPPEILLVPLAGHTRGHAGWRSPRRLAAPRRGRVLLPRGGRPVPAALPAGARPVRAVGTDGPRPARRKPAAPAGAGARPPGGHDVLGPRRGGAPPDDHRSGGMTSHCPAFGSTPGV